jgi:2-aminoadipate transaminase
MGQYGIRATVENVLLTSGAQQALDLMGRILLNPGDPILTENPTYLGALQAWRGYQADFVSVPIDDEGLQIDLLQETMCAGPKFMYILPNFQNPGGVTLSLERRQTLVATADRYGCPIVEDDPYGELRFEGEHLPPLVVLDADRLNHRAPDSHFDRGNVIYVSTFSKTLAPGLRLGWMVAPRGVIQRAVMAKQGMDLHTSSFVQRVVHEVVRDGFLPGHVRRIRDVYRQRRDLMLAELERHFPPGVRWTRPQGGLFLWAMLPEQIDSVALLKRAVENKVAFVPGANFYPDGSGHNTMRLNFSNATPEQIEVGIQRLGQVIADTLEEEPLAPALAVPTP